MDEKSHTAQQLIAMMDDLGLTQTAFCEKFGIPRRNLVYWLAGQRTPPEYVMRLLTFAVNHAEEFSEENAGN